MTKEQEEKLTEQIKTEMTRVRNDAIATGMKTVLSVIFDICKNDKPIDAKLREIEEFCDKGLHLIANKKK